jgi:hypothetical protein
MKWKQKKKGWVAREVEKERVIGDFVRSTSEPLCVEIEFELLVVFCSCLLVGVWCVVWVCLLGFFFYYFYDFIY